MESIHKAKQSISEMQEQLIDYLAAGEDTQDLTHLFSKLSVENPVAYELMLLMYQELQTKAKMDRKRLTKVITSLLSQNNVTYDKLIQHELRLNKDKNNDLASSHNAPVAESSFPHVIQQPPVVSNTTLPLNLYEAVIKWLSPKMVITLCVSFIAIIVTITLISEYNPEFYDTIMKTLTNIFGAKKA